MNRTIALQTKFLAPRRAAGYLPRPRLEDRLRAGLKKRLVLVSAPAGYGKTMLLAGLAEAPQMPLAWYQLDPADNDPSIFLGCLVQALGRAIGPGAGFGAAVTALLEAPDEAQAEPQRTLTVLINELTEAQAGPAALVVEDYHQLTNPAIHALVDTLLESAPPDFHLVLSTRVDPPLQLARLRARDQLAELHAADLRFTAEETRSWTELQAPGMSAQGIDALSAKTEGWAAALQIVFSSIRGQDPASAERFVATISGTQRHIFEYLAAEIFQRLSPAQQAFLLRTAVLDEMDAEACQSLSSGGEALLLLESLEAANLLSSSAGTDRQWYRYHQLFREFLLARLRREDPAAYQASQEQAGRYYEGRQELDLAFKHYIAARLPEDAARVLDEFAPEFVEYGRVEALHRALCQLDPDVLARYPELLLQRGNVLRRLGQAGAALASYEAARSVFRQYGSHAGVCRALTELANVNYSQGSYPEAQSLAAEALQQAAAEDHAERARALMMLAKCEGFLAGMDAGRRMAEQAIQEAHLAGELVSAGFKANLLQGLGQICWWHGDPQATVRTCREALQVLPERLSPVAARALISMVAPHLYWREFETALDYAERGLEIAQTLHLNELLPSAYAALGNVLTRLGETARAESALRQAMETAQRLGLASYERLMATGYLAYNLVGQGRLDEAHQLAEGALWSYTGNPDTYEVYVCRSVLADVALERQDWQEAEQLYLDLVETGERHQFRIPLALVYFGLAYICLTTGRQAQGLAHARKSFELIEPTKAIQLYLDQGARSRLVCRALVESGTAHPFLQRVLEHGERAGQGGPDLSVVDNKAVVVKLLGRFRVLVNDQEVPAERWVSTKARDLLAYFVTFRKERHDADRVLTAVWEESSGSGRTAFHTALSRLRRALRGEDQVLKYILIEKGEYWLDAARFAVDVDQFDFAVYRARSAESPAAAAEWLEHALNLVQGEYLANLHYEWVFPERRRLQQAVIQVLSRLAEIRAGAGEHARAVGYLERALELDPLLEPLHCRLMEAHAALGNQAAVARQYQVLCARLQAELAIAPAPETAARYRALLDQERAA